MRIGIMGSMIEEVGCLQDELVSKSKKIIAGREFISGKLYDIDTVIAFSKWGKVASAVTATNLINSFDVDCIIFTGVAGALSEELNIGDIVIGTEIYQHDIDAQPFFQKHQVPLTQDIFFQTEVELTKKLLTATNSFVSSVDRNIDKNILDEFKIAKPQIFCGKIATGDQFISCANKIKLVKQEMPDALAIEMEGGAVAQVCKDYDKPFAIFRSISDKANSNAAIDFPKYIDKVAKIYSLEIIKRFYELHKI
jgi:adenosylhomocysteine nucleosidase